MKRIAVLSVILIVMLALVISPVGAQPAAQTAAPDTSSLASFLLFLTSAGGVAMVLSFFQERSAWFQDRTANEKMVVTLLICFVLPAAALLIITYVPAAALAALDPFFKVAGMGLTAFLGSQIYHGSHKADGS